MEVNISKIIYYTHLEDRFLEGLFNSVNAHSLKTFELQRYIIIGPVNESPAMHCLGIPRHSRSMIAYKTLTEYFWKSQ